MMYNVWLKVFGRNEKEFAKKGEKMNICDELWQFRHKAKHIFTLALQPLVLRFKYKYTSFR